MTLPERTAILNAKNQKLMVHTVQSGDSLWALSRKYGTSVDAIRQANNLTSNALSLGQRLKIPGVAPRRQPSRSSRASSSRPTASRPKVERPRVPRPSVREKPPQQVDITTPDGKTSSSVHSPSRDELRRMEAHKRATLHVAVENGRAILGNGLTGSVGSGGQNNPRDLAKVHERLRALGLTGSAMSPSAIGIAIGKFQKRNDVAWWAKATGRGSGKPMLSSSTYYSNKVTPGDATFIMLRDLSEYTMQFKDYRNRVQKVETKNFVKSSFAEDPMGVSYHGDKVFPIPASYYTSIGMDASMAKVLEFVSKNEGNFDAINSWDRAFFSFGFVQFAGGGRSLHTLLALIKYRRPYLFNDCFQRFGIDVEYSFRNNRFSGQRTVTIDEQGRIRRGDEAEKHIGEDKVLTTAFLRAGHDPEIAKLQVLLAAYEYANPALRRKITVTAAGGVNIRSETSSFIRSPAGLTALVDMSVNQGVGGASRLFASAISSVAQEQGLRTEAQLQAINEEDVLRRMVQQNTNDSRITSRVGKALQHLSTSK